MPFRPAMKLKVTAHMFVASQSPDAFRAASEVLDKVRAQIHDLGFEGVEVSGSVGQLRTEAAPKKPKTVADVEKAFSEEMTGKGAEAMARKFK